MPVVAVAIALGLDNLRVMTVLAAAGITRRVALRLILAFAAFEAIMPLVGLVLASTLVNAIGPWADMTGIAALASSGIYVLVSAGRNGPTRGLPDRTWVVLGLPLSLSADNLVMGAGLGLLGYPAIGAALIFGGVTAVMCLFGFWAGEAIAASSPRRAQLVGGVALVAFALVGVAGQIS